MSHQFDFTVQRQINNKFTVEVGYIGRILRHEFMPLQINAVPYMMTLGGNDSTRLMARWFGNTAAVTPVWPAEIALQI